MKCPCYTTKTGIRIGSAYEPAPRQLTYDEERIQSALLGANKRHLSLRTIAMICLAVFVSILWIGKP